jgi:hypothetical protein
MKSEDHRLYVYIIKNLGKIPNKAKESSNSCKIVRILYQNFFVNLPNSGITKKKLHKILDISGRKFLFFWSNYHSQVPEKHKEYMDKKDKANSSNNTNLLKTTDYHNLLYFMHIEASAFSNGREDRLTEF